jgi:hypothetical protein
LLGWLYRERSTFANVFTARSIHGLVSGGCQYLVALLLMVAWTKQALSLRHFVVAMDQRAAAKEL